MKRRENHRVVVALVPLLLITSICACASAGESWGDWPQGKDPKTIGKRLAVNLVERSTYMVGRNGGLQYPEVCTAYGAMRFADAIGFSTPRKQAALEAMLAETTRYATKPGTALIAREVDGQEEVYNLTEPLHHSYIVDGVVVANCSEYMSIDDSACNLASLNLMKFRRADGTLDVDTFNHVVDIVFLAQ